MQSKKLALTSLILSLLSWIPLFNLAIAPSALYLGVRSLILIKRDPENYGGKGFAVAGVVIGGIVTFFTYSWLVLRMLGKA